MKDDLFMYYNYATVLKKLIFVHRLVPHAMKRLLSRVLDKTNVGALALFITCNISCISTLNNLFC